MDSQDTNEKDTVLKRLKRKTYKYRIYPTKEQLAILLNVIEICCWTYNTALQQRRKSYENWKKEDVNTRSPKPPTINYNTQSAAFTQAKSNPDSYHNITAIHDKILRNVLQRVHATFQDFFRRVKNGEKAGYPRYKGKNRYDSFSYKMTAVADSKGNYNAGAWTLEGNKLLLSMGSKGQPIGPIKVKLHRPLKGEVRVLTITHNSAGEWYVCFSVVEEKQTVTPDETCKMVGVALGLKHLVTLSTGETKENPRYYEQDKNELNEAKQSYERKLIARKQNGIQENANNCINLKKARRKVAKVYRHTTNKRHDNLHKISHDLVKRFGVIVVGKMDIASMTRRNKPVVDQEKLQEEGRTVYAPNNQGIKTNYTRATLDAGWGILTKFIAYKAADADKLCIEVDSCNTSQSCCNCGWVADKPLAPNVRMFRCEKCGLKLARNHNAAINLLEKQFGANCVEVVAIKRQLAKREVTILNKFDVTDFARGLATTLQG